MRTAKFVEREQWIVTGSDDKFIRVYDYNSAEKIKEFEAHTDFIRSVAVHPTLPYVLSASDDKLIKLWDWEKDWACTRVFEGHSHYVMGVAFEPKNAVVFASASLDRSVKVCICLEKSVFDHKQPNDQNSKLRWEPSWVFRLHAIDSGLEFPRFEKFLF